MSHLQPLVFLLACLVLGAVIQAEGCPNGWTYNKDNKHCYRFFNERKSYDDARKTCQTNATNSDLATPRTEAENEFVYELMKSASAGGLDFDVYIGLDDRETEGSFQWVKGERNVTWANWDDGQPDDYSNNQDCARQWNTHATKKWDDGGCSEAYKFVCEATIEDAPDNDKYFPGVNDRGHAYYVSRSPAANSNVSQAATICAENLSGYLVEIEDQSEWNLIKQLIAGAPSASNFNSFIIGGSYNAAQSTIVGRNGNAISFSKWISGEPNNAGGNENCIEITAAAEYNDFACSHGSDAPPRSFICEIEFA